VKIGKGAMVLGVVVALGALFAGGGKAKGSSGKAGAPTKVGVQVDKLLDEPHTAAELERAATMLDGAGYKADAKRIRSKLGGSLLTLQTTAMYR